MILEKINNVNDIKNIPEEDLGLLAEEIRQFLIENISVTGGHLASNLGVVELTIALHRVFMLPKDKIIWDVGHQSYTHKLLTGRKDEFGTLRKFGGMSGFPKRKESDCDSFDTGHSSTSISAGLGYAQARELSGADYRVVSVIGDGSMTGGMAFEALNNAALLKKNFVIVLNDNTMSISKNVGGLPAHLAGMRTANAYLDLKEGVTNSLSRIPKYGQRMVENIRKTKSGIKQLLIPPGMIFENLGVTYLGPFDGHNIAELVRILTEATKVEGAVVVHVLTKKGRGYLPAERHPARFHGTAAFDIKTGLPKEKQTKANYTDVFSTAMCKIGEQDKNIVAITAAMEDGVGLKRFHSMFPERFFDVGIAEGHAVTFAAALAVAGLKPVLAVYSSFLQRGFDQIIHDVCIQNLPVVLAIDRAGLVGADGETHQGLFDLSYLSMMPNMAVMAPKNKWELSDMLKFAVDYPAPIALRYPRGTAYDGCREFRAPIEYGKSEMLYDEENIALFAIGSMVETALEVRSILKEKGIGCTVVNARFAKPVDQEMLRTLENKHFLVVTMEENIGSGGLGSHVLEFAAKYSLNYMVFCIALPDEFIEHGNVALLKQEIGLDAVSIAGKIDKVYKQELVKREK